MLKKYAEGMAPLDLLEEREALLSLLPSTSPNCLLKNTAEYTIDPKTRYQNINQAAAPSDFDLLYDSDTVSRPPARKKPPTTPKPAVLPTRESVNQYKSIRIVLVIAYSTKLCQMFSLSV